MEKQHIFSQLPDALLPWYENHKRDLPWRKSPKPYFVWVSEIMLQQTRVEAVKGYYSRFLTALPTVEMLAAAEDELLHKLWEGLGYYTRVRNLKKAAQIIVEKFGGQFPTSYEDIRALPGIGDYTAGAICSIAYNLPIPAVDGNVLRVVARLTDDAAPIDTPACKKRAAQNLAAVYPQKAGEFTQALMELGATLCGPNRKPECEKCPCNGFCLGYLRGTVESLPVKSLKRARTVEEKTVFILSCDGEYALQKRPAKGLLANLWQFPNISPKLEDADAIAEAENLGVKPKEILRSVERNHIFTHREWHMRGIYMEVAEKTPGFTWMRQEQIEGECALPTAFRQFWEER